MRRLAAFLLVLTVTLPACGDDGGPRAAGTAATGPSLSPGTQTASPADGTGGSDGGETTDRGDDAVPSRSGARSPSPLPSGPADHNTMPLAVTLNRTCVQPGQEMRATAVTEEGSKLAFAASYSDNDMVPDFTYTPAEANPTGTFTWTWVIRPNIPPGDALVTVVAAKNKRGASFEHPFRVAQSC